MFIILNMMGLDSPKAFLRLLSLAKAEAGRIIELVFSTSLLSTKETG